MDVIHFANGPEFRRWLEKHHATASELRVGFYKKQSGKTGMTYFEAVDEALCFGWIDGVIRRLDEESYCHRFTRRTLKSTWSLINVAKVKALLKEGRMHAAGIAAFEARSPAKTGIYTYEQAKGGELLFSSAMEQTFRADKKAWALWKECPPAIGERFPDG